MAKNTVIVSILADTKQFAKGFQDSTGVLGQVASLGKNVVKTAAGAAAAVVGLAAAGGFARALKLDEARTQLGALGYSGQQMQSIMDSALKSVKGTAYGLDAAATIAAQALASGVQPGQQLTSSLTTVANTAALAKTDMGEMGSIFAKVWANGKVTTQEMNQLADRGVPIWQYLGKTFNVSNSELRSMIEQGKITADMFMNSLGPAVDGMATKMSGGFKGMSMNALAALSRVGAMFAGPLLDSAKGFLGEATTLTDGLGTRLQPVADKWAAFLGQFSSSGLASGALSFLDKITASVGGVVQFVSTFSPLSILLQALVPVFPQLAGSLAQLGQALASGLVALGPSLVDVLGSVLTLAAQIVPPVASLVSWVLQAAAGVVTWVIANRDWLSGLGVAAGVIAGVVAAVSAFKAVQLGIVAATYGAQGAMLVAGGAAKVYGVAIGVMNGVSKVAAAAQWAWNVALSANPIGIIITAIAALVAGLVYFFTQTKLGKQIWAEFTRFLGEAWNNIVKVATTVFGALASFFTDFWNGIVAGWNALVGFVSPIFEFIGAVIKTYIDIWVNIFIVLAAVLVTIWNGIVAVVTTVWNAIVAFLTPIVQGIADFIGNVILGAQIVWNAVWGAISSFFTGIWNGIVSFLTPIVQTVSNVIGGAVSTVQGIWNSAWGAISSFFSGIWNGIVSAASGAVRSVVGVVSGIQGAVMGALNGAGQWLVDVGRNIIQGLIDGIGGAFNWVKNTIQDLGGNILGWAKGVLGIKSPSREFAKIGGFIGQGLGNGIASTTALVRNATERLAGTVVDSFSADLNGGMSVSIASPDAQRGGAVYNINVTGGIQSGAEIGRAIVDAIRQYEAAGGRA